MDSRRSATPHETGVATQPGPYPLSATVAWCSCGWKSPLSYATRAEGQAVADQHVADEIGASLQLMADAMAIPSENNHDDKEAA